MCTSLYYDSSFFSTSLFLYIIQITLLKKKTNGCLRLPPTPIICYIFEQATDEESKAKRKRETRGVTWRRGRRGEERGGSLCTICRDISLSSLSLSGYAMRFSSTISPLCIFRCRESCPPLLLLLSLLLFTADDFFFLLRVFSLHSFSFFSFFFCLLVME